MLEILRTHLPTDVHSFQEATRKDPFYFGWKVNLSMVRTLADGTVLALQQLKQPKYPFLVMISPNPGRQQDIGFQYQNFLRILFGPKSPSGYSGHVETVSCLLQVFDSL